MKMEGISSTGNDENLLTALDWTEEEVIALGEAIIADGRCILPVGVNKHFNMISILRRFQQAIKKKVDPSVLWDRFNDSYDMAKLDTLAICPFPNDQCDFSLPESDFSHLMKDRKGQTSQDKLLDEESRDSGSGRETPPTLPIAKRGASSSQASNKRKYSSSVSETGSDSGGGRDRKSTPSASSKPKQRRI